MSLKLLRFWSNFRDRDLCFDFLFKRFKLFIDFTLWVSELMRWWLGYDLWLSEDRDRAFLDFADFDLSTALL